MMKVLSFLSASFLLASAEFYLPPYTPANSKDMCSMLLWTASNPLQDPCLIGKVQHWHPGVWKNSTACLNRTTPLHEVAARGHRVMMRALLAQGADLEARDSSDKTPLHHAANTTRPSVAFELLHAGADPNAADANGDTPLHVAVREYARVSPQSYPYRDSSRQVEKQVLQLLVAGANRSAVNALGETPTSIATEARADIAFYLLGGMFVRVQYPQEMCVANRDPYYDPQDGRKSLTDDTDWCGQNELFRHFSGWYDIGDLTADNTTDVNAKDLVSDTVLHTVARTGKTWALKYLLEKGADINARNWLGETPLHAASLCREYEMMKKLLAAGADSTAKDKLGRTPDDVAKDVVLRPLSSVKN